MTIAPSNACPSYFRAHIADASRDRYVNAGYHLGRHLHVKGRPN